MELYLQGLRHSTLSPHNPAIQRGILRVFVTYIKCRENFVKKMANCSSPAGSVLGGAAHLAVMVAVMRGAILVQTVCTP